MTSTNPFSIYPLQASSSPSDKPKSQGQTTDSGKLLREIQAANRAEQREVMAALRQQGSPGAMGVYAAQELLQWLEETFPCLSYRQRVTLVSGHGLRSKSSLDSLEIAEVLMAWWCRAEDPDAVSAQVELLVCQGNLPSGSRCLLSDVRDRVNQWRLDQRLPRLREITQSWQQLKRWAQANDQELSLDLDAGTAAEMTNAIAGLQAELHSDEPLVFGLVDAHEARLWLLCCDSVSKGNAGLDPEKSSFQKMERKAAELMDTCLRLNVNHPEDIQPEMKKRRGIWDGYPGAILQDSRGRWFYGDGTPAIPQPGGGFKRQRSGLGGLFEGVDRSAIWDEIGRCFEKEREQMKRNDVTPDSKKDSD